MAYASECLVSATAALLSAANFEFRCQAFLFGPFAPSSILLIKWKECTRFEAAGVLIGSALAYIGLRATRLTGKMRNALGTYRSSKDSRALPDRLLGSRG